MDDLETRLRQHNSDLLEPRTRVEDAAKRDIAVLGYLLEKYGPEGIPALMQKARALNEQVYEEIARAERLL